MRKLVVGATKLSKCIPIVLCAAQLSLAVFQSLTRKLNVGMLQTQICIPISEWERSFVMR